MLNELTPEMLKVPYARNNATVPEPIAHYMNKTSQFKAGTQRLAYAIQKSPNPMRYLFKKFKKIKTPPTQNKPYNRSLVECLQQQAQIPEIAQYFSKSRLNRVINCPQEYGEDALSYLFTILSVIEDFHGNTWTIDKFQNTDWYANEDL